MDDNIELRSRGGSCVLNMEHKADAHETAPLVLPPSSSREDMTSSSSDDVDVLPASDRGEHEDSVDAIVDAVERGLEDNLCELLKATSKLDVHRAFKKNLLHKAIDTRSVSMVKLLIDKLKEQEPIQTKSDLSARAWVNEQDECKFTPLHKATLRNESKILQILLDNGGDVAAKNDRGQTPLHIAAWRGSLDCAELLLAKVSESGKKDYMETRDNCGQTALIRAAKWNHLRVGRLLKGSDVNLQDNRGDTALHCSARYATGRFVNFLLRARADPTKRNNKGRLPLEATVLEETGNVEGMKSLLRETKLKKEEEYFNMRTTLLKEATINNSYACLQNLLSHQNFKDLLAASLPDEDNDTLLHLALKHKRFGVALLLLDKGADKINKNKHHEYPLHYLAKVTGEEYRTDSDVLKVHKIIVKGLREILQSTNSSGKGVMEFAVAAGNKEMIRHLFRNKCSRKAGVLEAARLGRNSCLQMLLTAVPQNQMQEIYALKPHPLHLAAEYGHMDCCETILQAYADNAPPETSSLDNPLFAKNNKNKYPADVAYDTQHYEIFSLLLGRMEASPPRKEFGGRLHVYCKESILRRSRAPVEAIISSSWCCLALDSTNCTGNLERPSSGGATFDLVTGRPCVGMALLVKSYPDLAFKALDQHVTDVPSGGPEDDDGARHLEEWHDYTPFEVTFIAGDREKPRHRGEEGSVSGPPTMNKICWTDHPLIAAVDHSNKEFLEHKLSKNWISLQFQAYAKWLLLLLVGLDFCTAVGTSCMLCCFRNTHHLEVMFNGASRNEIVEVCSTLEQVKSSNTLVNSLFQEVQAASALDRNCSGYGVANSQEMLAGTDHYLLPGSSVWNRSVCALSQLERLPCPVVFLQVLVTILAVLNVVLHSYIVCKVRRRNIVYPALLRGAFLLVLLAALMCCGSWCDFKLGLRAVMVWQVGVISVLLAWLLFIKTLSEVPCWSFSLMQIPAAFMKSYFLFLFFFIFIISAFALVFNLVLGSEESGFGSVWQSLVKSLIWSIGDYDYNHTFLQRTPLTYPVLSNILFVLFIAITLGFLMNILAAIPKKELEDFKWHASFYRTETTLMLILIVDEAFPCIRKQQPRKQKVKTLRPRQTQSSVTCSQEPTDHRPQSEIFRMQRQLLQKLNQQQDDICCVATLSEQLRKNEQLLQDLLSELKRKQKSSSSIASTLPDTKPPQQ